MDNSVKGRLISYLDAKGISKADFGRAIGVSGSYITSMRKSIQPDKLKRIAEEFPDLNRDWLLYGEGEMLNDTAADEAPAVDAARVPLIPAEAFAGPIVRFLGEGVTADHCRRVITPVAGAEMAIPVSGDSMEPAIHDGSLLYIKRINDAAFIPWGNILVLDTENGALVKQIYPVPGRDDLIEARSVNPAYPPFNIPRESIYGVFRILGTFRFHSTL